MLANFGANKPLATGTLHPAVSAIMKAADVGRANNLDVIMRIKLLIIKCQSVCAIEGLFEGRGALANLVMAAEPTVSSSKLIVVFVFVFVISIVFVFVVVVTHSSFPIP
jgi:hypothetical protein